MNLINKQLHSRGRAWDRLVTVFCDSLVVSISFACHCRNLFELVLADYVLIMYLITFMMYAEEKKKSKKPEN